MSLVDRCLRIYVRVCWCLLGFVSVDIGVCIRLVPTNIYNSRLVPTKNYKEKFIDFLPKEFPHKSRVPCSTINRSHM
jgi:hypothetical protein